MLNNKIMKSLKPGTYSVTLKSYDTIITTNGAEGLKLVFQLEDSANGGVLREKTGLFFGYKIEETLEALCDQFDSDFDTVDQLMDYFKAHKAVVNYSKTDEYAVWDF